MFDRLETQVQLPRTSSEPLIWEGHVLDMLEEPQREGRAPPFEFGDANIRDGAKKSLARIKSGPTSLESREAIAGLEALLADLTWRRAWRRRVI